MKYAYVWKGTAMRLKAKSDGRIVYGKIVDSDFEPYAICLVTSKTPDMANAQHFYYNDLLKLIYDWELYNEKI